MTDLAWFLSEVALGVALGLAAAQFQRWVRRCRTRRFVRRVHEIERRSRTPGGSATTPDRHDPQVSSGPRAGGGGAPDHGSDTPPAPSTLAGVTDPRSVTLARLHVSGAPR